MNQFASILIAISLCSNSAIAQEKPIQGWHLMSIKDSKKTAGIGANQAYELVNNREAKPIIVAVYFFVFGLWWLLGESERRA